MASVEGKRWLCVDPGETTGWSVWRGEKLLGGGQTPLWDFAHDVWDTLAYDKDLRRNPGPLSEGERPWLAAGVTGDDNEGDLSLIVCEKFALYPDKAKDLAYDEFRTVQLIGALTFMATLFDIEMHKQPATIKKPATDAGAKELFVRPLHENRHTNDSIMHGWFYLLVECRNVHLMVKDSAAEVQHHPV
jgi:hypothetical protein